MKENLKKNLRAFLGAIQNLIRSVAYLGRATPRAIAIVTPDDRVEFEKRLTHFVPELAGQCEISLNIPFVAILSGIPILQFSASAYGSKLARIFTNFYVLDYRTCPHDAWNWFKLSKLLNAKDIQSAVQIAKPLLIRKVKYLSEKYSSCYIFGTGTSLEIADRHDWSNGSRIVCNTIVRDEALWKHIAPHFIVAGDALYHFGHTEFAKSFRFDLKSRLEESNTLFVYPDIYHKVVIRDLSEFSEKLVPIPYSSRTDSTSSLLSNYSLPEVGNVLNLLLLPLACTLSKDVRMWGFDGRAPSDKLFWSNSERHFYPEYVPKLQEAHPAFFDFLVPRNNPAQYVQKVHGDELDANLRKAEKNGWRFTMLHFSWTKTLQTRFRGENL